MKEKIIFLHVLALTLILVMVFIFLSRIRFSKPIDIIGVDERELKGSIGEFATPPPEATFSGAKGARSQ